MPGISESILLFRVIVFSFLLCNRSECYVIEVMASLCSSFNPNLLFSI
jgi:hypothetical protein